MKLIKLDGKWINPKYVVAVYEKNDYIEVQLISGVSVGLAAMELDKVAAILNDRVEEDEPIESDGVVHYHELGRATPLCWIEDKGEPFQWFDSLSGVDCDACHEIVVQRRSRF